ncbi:dTDP-4-dehydrorhamnose reductase [Celeribacter indicus]|uniref:dTDP-4-dehydrorhamnose reductase n=1 Tax=Celeribacter indicus TaxID=1208324 RepID=A0A0B5DQQ7_9RHOB|nr:dTDP-4-dehydrorhamnose reductase [Celeribacter indicus]AJE45429.1 dTDP-4-dehydrorhamnose reductase [Celeribacter indicus]SDX01765.1 dTDP-4-dehydrorhamnose reductase [Celeribacter indicus]
MILVFGRTGQVARELRARLPEARFLGRDEADLADPAGCAARIAELAPEAVINAAAYTAVDRAESEEDLARLVNGAAPAAMARACAARGIPLVHLSTDYVFDGAGETPFAPDHPTAPLGAYGRTKLAGEEGVRAANGPHAILRTSWVFSAHGGNFVKTMLRLGAGRERLTVVADQVGGPTSAAAIAEACIAILRAVQDTPARSGTYHLSGAPDVSWAEFAREIFARSGLPCAVEDIPASAYPTPARRPANSRLDCAATTAAFGLSRPDWRRDLDDVLHELEALP